MNPQRRSGMSRRRLLQAEAGAAVGSVLSPAASSAEPLPKGNVCQNADVKNLSEFGFHGVSPTEIGGGDLLG